MNEIFISYAHEDSGVARNLANALMKSRIPVWWDPDIQIGQPYAPAIKAALGRVSAVVVLWSRSSVGSDWVIDEARTGLNRGVLLPVLIDNVTPPYEFAALDCANLIGWAPNKPHTEFEQIRKALLNASGAGGGAAHGAWHAEMLSRDTIGVQLDQERHTVQYTKGHIYVDGLLVQEGLASVIARRDFRFELSDGPQTYMAELSIWVTAFRGDVKRMELNVGGTALRLD
ncbi:MAG: toll/interleukin-1 receptor domain-containing protein [Acidobacteriota bacterium]|nr:toll/interleukin-1 receptor domain-containing protein [Acidobacteriota bacterium]